MNNFETYLSTVLLEARRTHTGKQKRSRKKIVTRREKKERDRKYAAKEAEGQTGHRMPKITGIPGSDNTDWSQTVTYREGGVYKTRRKTKAEQQARQDQIAAGAEDKKYAVEAARRMARRGTGEVESLQRPSSSEVRTGRTQSGRPVTAADLLKRRR